MKTKKHILYMLCLLFSSVAFSQITFETVVSKKKLGVNERLRVDFKMDKNGDNFVQPDFVGFRIAAGPIQSMNHYESSNGHRSFSKSYTYYLQPKAEGKYTIKQATIEFEGNVYKTSPVQIIVTKAVEKPKDGNNSEYIVSEGIHLVTEISKGNPYLNEPITVSYKLYVKPRGINIRDYRPTGKPKFNNFWSQEIQTKLRAQRGEYNGENYNYVVLKRYVLYPQKTGKLNIEPFSIDIELAVETNRRDVFGRRYTEPIHKTISSARRRINVKAFPEEGKPESFNGAVGKFNLKVTTNKTELDALESLQAKVEVSGKGNLKLFDLPKLKLPNSLEVYEPEFKEKISTRISGMQGRITDDYTVVPQFKGKYPIPSIEFSYFDPASKTYKTLKSEEILINVINGPVNTASTQNKTNESQTQKIALANIGEQFRFIKTTANLEPIEQKDFFKSNLFYGLLISPFLMIPLFLIARRKKQAFDNDIQGSKTRIANRLAKKYLSEAKKTLGQKEVFYEALERALHNYLRAKLSIETSEFSKEKISSLLSERKVNEVPINNFVELFESCEFARYTPASDVTMHKDYKKSVQTIAQIDKQIRLSST